MWVPARRHDSEWMDRTDNTAEDLSGALHDLKLTNRYLGGRRALLRGLDPWLARHVGNTRLEILDVGTGGADLPVEIVRRARRLGIAVRVTAIDRDPIIVGLASHAVAGQNAVRVLQADAAALPFE